MYLKLLISISISIYFLLDISSLVIFLTGMEAGGALSRDVSEGIEQFSGAF